MVVGMSAKGGSDMKERAEEVGMDGFLLKPFRLNQLMECITEGGSGRQDDKSGKGSK
jgi:CheY-like chemotaxis protein